MWRLKTPLFPYKPQQEVADVAEERAIKTWLRERERVRRWAAIDDRHDAAKVVAAMRTRPSRP